MLECLALGARLADPKFREIAANDLFTGEIADVVNAAAGKQSGELWKWLKANGVERNGEEKPLESIIRTLAENRDRRKCVRQIMDAVHSLRPGEISRAQLMEIRDKIYGRSDPEVATDVSGQANPTAKIAIGSEEQKGS